MERTIASLFLVALTAACGGGDAQPVDDFDDGYGVPNDTVVPNGTSVPNDTVVPNDSNDPNGAAAPGVGTPEPGVPGGANSECVTLCGRMEALQCTLDVPGPACAGECTASLASEPCGREGLRVLACILDQGVCLEDASDDPSLVTACAAAIQNAAACEQAQAG
jgi:hypothetical protein